MTIRPAMPHEAETIAEIMCKARAAMPDPGLYIPDDLDFIRRHLGGEGFTLLACDEQAGPVAFFLVRYPMNCHKNLGRYLGYADEALLHVAQMESAAVLPEFQGRGLQRALFEAAEARVDPARFCYFLGTVAPENHASRRTFEKMGYRRAATIRKNGGLVRFVMEKIAADAEAPAGPEYQA